MKMADDDFDDIMFQAPVDDEAEEEIIIPNVQISSPTTTTPIKKSEISDVSAAATGGSDQSSTTDRSPTYSASSTMMRLVLNRGKKSKNFVGDGGDGGLENSPSDVAVGEDFLDDAKKREYVSNLLKKLSSIDTFDDDSPSNDDGGDRAYRYWHTLAFLLSIDESESPICSTICVQNGVVAMIGRNLHDFITFARKSAANLRVLTEILRCAVAITANSIVGFDLSCLGDILSVLIDLNGWNLVETIVPPSPNQSHPTDGTTFHVNLGPKLSNTKKKLSMLFPSILSPMGVTDFDMNVVEFVDYSSSIIQNSRIWKLKPPLRPTSDREEDRPTIRRYDPADAIKLIAICNPTTYLIADRNHQKYLDAINTVINRLDAVECFGSRPFPGTPCLVRRGDEDIGGDRRRQGEFYRAVITSIDGGKSEANVFAMDYGFEKRVQLRDLSQMTDDLKSMKPALRMYCLQDALPAPNLSAFEETLKIYYNLSSIKNMHYSLIKRDVIDSLLTMLRLIDQESTVEMALKILVNTAVPSTDERNMILEMGGIEKVFALGADLMEKVQQMGGDPIDDSSAAIRSLQYVVECLTNLARYSQQARQRLVEMKASFLPNYILSKFEQDTPIHRAASNFVGALFTETIGLDEWQEKKKEWAGKFKKDSDCAALNKLLVESLKVKGGKDPIEALFTPEMAKSTLNLKTPKETLKPTPEVEDVLRRISSPITGDRTYIRDQQIEISTTTNKDDQQQQKWIVICDDITDLHDLKTQFVQELCCAALNSRQRLTMYFGVARDGRVRGIRVNNWEIDEFRIGIDWSLSRALRPFLEPTMYNVEFVPVCVGEHQPKPIPDLFVVELQIRHLATVAYQLDKDGAAYFRINDEVVRLNLNEAGEYFAHRLCEEKLKELRLLRGQVGVMKALLAGKEKK